MLKPLRELRKACCALSACNIDTYHKMHAYYIKAKTQNVNLLYGKIKENTASRFTKLQKVLHSHSDNTNNNQENNSDETSNEDKIAQKSQE